MTACLFYVSGVLMMLSLVHFADHRSGYGLLSGLTSVLLLLAAFATN